MNWLKFKRPDYGNVELFLIRATMASLIWILFFYPSLKHAEQTEPVGLALFFDLSFLMQDETFAFLKLLFGIALILFTLGILPILSTGYMVLLMSAVGALRNSYGNIHHGTQLVALVILATFAAYVWRAFRSDRPVGKRLLWADRKDHAEGMWWALQMAFGTYVVAAISKIDRSGFGWMFDVRNISFEVQKIGWQHYYGHGDKTPLEHADKIGAMITDYPVMTCLLIGSGLLFELFAFVGLINRLWATVIGVIILVMHYMILYIMQLTFPMNNYVILIYMINIPFYVMLLLRVLRIYDDRPKEAVET